MDKWKPGDLVELDEVGNGDITQVGNGDITHLRFFSFFSGFCLENE